MSSACRFFCVHEANDGSQTRSSDFSGMSRLVVRPLGWSGLSNENREKCLAELVLANVQHGGRKQHFLRVAEPGFGSAVGGPNGTGVSLLAEIPA